MFKKAFASVAVALSILNATAFAGPNGRSYYEYGSFVLNNPTNAYGVDDAADGKDYSFGYTDDGRFLDLFEG
jgi:hypothetical protein